MIQLKDLQTVDYVRSGALVLAYCAIVIGDRKGKDNSIFLLVDSITTFCFGLGYFIFPQILLGYTTNGTLSESHLQYARMVGSAMIGMAVISYYLRNSTNNGTWVIARFSGAMLLLASQGAMYNQSKQKDAVSFSNEHVTFVMLSTGLQLLLSIIMLFRVQTFGRVDRQMSPLTLPDKHLIVDLLLTSVAVFVQLGPQEFLSKVISIKTPTDAVATLLYRSVGCYMLGYLMFVLMVIRLVDMADKKAVILGKLVFHACVVALSLWHVYLGQQPLPVNPVFVVLPALVKINIAIAYYNATK